MPLIRERISVWENLRTLIMQGEFDYFFADPSIEPTKLPSKNESVEDVRKHLSYVREQFSGFDEETSIDPEKIKAALWDYATENGRGNVLWPLRFALTGADKSPDPFIVASIIGVEAVVRRIGTALQTL
jgi:glutamyl/glutaminyl-tRNA synthetase